MTRARRIKHIDIVKRVRKAAPLAVLAVAEQGAGQAKAIVTVGDGQLRGSISAQSVSRTRAVYGTNVEHGVYVEFGTGKFAEKGGRQTPWTYFSEKLQRFVRTEGMPAQPYLRPSADWLRSKASATYARTLRRLLRG